MSYNCCWCSKSFEGGGTYWDHTSGLDWIRPGGMVIFCSNRCSNEFKNAGCPPTKLYENPNYNVRGKALKTAGKVAAGVGILGVIASLLS